MKSEWTSTETPDGPMRVYVATPDGAGPFPGVVVVQEIFGVSEHIRNVTEKLAEAGFVAAAPEIFHRFDTSVLASGNVQDAIGLAKQLTVPMAMADVGAVCDLLAARSDVKADAIGIVGFCMGGRIAFVAAQREPRVKGAVCFYGGGIASDAADAPLKTASELHAPVLMFYGANDPSITVEQTRAVEAELTRLGKAHEVVVYPDAGHAFMRDRPAPAPTYVAGAAGDAWGRTVEFFKRMR